MALASEIATAEIHAPAAGLITERKINGGDKVVDANRAELFRIAVHPELLRAEFDAGTGLQAGRAITLRAGDAVIRSVMSSATTAEFESHLGSVTIGTPCSATIQIK